MSLPEPDIDELRKRVGNNSETSDDLSFFDLVFTITGLVGLVMFCM